MKQLLLPAALLCLLTACDWAKRKTKETVHKTGEVVAKAGSEFADGVAKGVEKTFTNEVTIAEPLAKQGFKTGRISFHGTDSSRDNILTVYVIYDNNIDRQITAKVYDDNQQEYGRTSLKVKGNKGEAQYVDFVFDKRTNIDSKGMVSFE
jgi:hypothetical protein